MLLLHDGTFPIKLSPSTQKSFHCRAGVDIYDLEPTKFLILEQLKADLEEQGEHSDFFPFREQILKSLSLEPLLLYDSKCTHGSNFLLCLNEESKLGYLQAEEDGLMRMVKKPTQLKNEIPTPKEWETKGSGKVIEGTWVEDLRPRIRLQIRRSLARKHSLLTLSDRGASDVKDGYVCCEPYEETKPFRNVSLMNRGIQAVPTVVEGEAQTELKHPKNFGIEYEARVFDPEQVAELWKSKEMKLFLENAEKIMAEVSQQPDIMGDFRPAVEAFYRRDEVVYIEETQFAHKIFFSDLTFTGKLRVTQIRWHPSISDVLALVSVQNAHYEEYLDNISQRLVTPNVITIWSIKYPFFPQVLLRICDDISQFQWHPKEPEILVGGCTSGQLMIWDIGQYLSKLQEGRCTWDHKVFLNNQSNKLHLQDGFIPVLHWSAESDKEYSHLSSVSDLQWLPAAVWFSHDSAYPKKNLNENEYQLISCDCDRSVLIWALRKPPSDSLTLEQDNLVIEAVEDGVGTPSSGTKTFKPHIGGEGWEKLKLQSALPAATTGKGKKYSPAIGKYESLNKIWRPVHRICFLDPHLKHEEKLFQVVITSINVIDRPDLFQCFARKESVAQPGSSSMVPQTQPAAPEAQDESKVVTVSKKGGKEAEEASDKKEETWKEEETHYDASDESEEEEEEEDPVHFALPTFLMAGTIYGAIFRVDLTKVKVDVETNDLICKVDWDVSIHDGPVTIMARSPHSRHLLLTVGGYSWAIWNESDMPNPVVLHYTENCYFTSAAWSLAQPNVIFFGDDSGKLQVWDIKSRKAEPFQTQYISGRTITAVAPYCHQVVTPNGESSATHYISVADDTGTLHVLHLPKHLYTKSGHEMDDILEFIDLQVQKLLERKRLQHQREEEQGTTSKKTDKQIFEDERHITWEEEEYLKGYFKREKQVLWNLYGNEWKNYFKFSNLPRKKYFVEDKKRDSSEERKRQKDLAAKAKKKKGGSIFRKYNA